MSKELPIQLRPAIAADVPFIFNSWLKSYKSSEFAKPIANEIYYSEHHKAIEDLLKTYDVIVACNPEDPSQLYGYICAGATEGIFTLNYIYVKHTFRRMGIGKALLNSFEHSPENASVYTHRTPVARHLSKKYNFIYHPYIALKTKEYKKGVK